MNLSKEQVGLTLSAFLLQLRSVPGTSRFALGSIRRTPDVTPVHMHLVTMHFDDWTGCRAGNAVGDPHDFRHRSSRLLSDGGSLIRRWIPLAGRGSASAIVSFGGRLGAALTPVLTAWLLRDYVSWRALLMIYGLIGFAVAAAFWWICRETPDEHPRCDQAERDLIQPAVAAPPWNHLP